MSELASPRLADSRPRTSDPDEFQLPLSGLFADLELGCGSLQLPDDFAQCQGLVQLKILSDWDRSLARYRHAAMRQYMQELSRGRPELGAAERLGLLRSTCESLHIELPSELGTMPAPP